MMMIRVDLARLALAREDLGVAESIAGASAEWWRERRIPMGEARALVIRSEALMRLGRLPEARQAAARVRVLAGSGAKRGSGVKGGSGGNGGSGEDRDLALVVAPELARVEAAGGDPERALTSLRQASAEARRRGFIAAEMEARLASGEIEMHREHSTGTATLHALRREAEKSGYGRLVRRTEKILKEAGRS